jgi:PKD repeat protein
MREIMRNMKTIIRLSIILFFLFGNSDDAISQSANCPASPTALRDWQFEIPANSNNTCGSQSEYWHQAIGNSYASFRNLRMRNNPNQQGEVQGFYTDFNFNKNLNHTIRIDLSFTHTMHNHYTNRPGTIKFMATNSIVTDVPANCSVDFGSIPASYTPFHTVDFYTNISVVYNSIHTFNYTPSDDYCYLFVYLDDGLNTPTTLTQVTVHSISINTALNGNGNGNGGSTGIQSVSFARKCSNIDFNFNNISNISTINWNFGEGSPYPTSNSNVTNPTHSYSSPGTYWVTVWGETSTGYTFREYKKVTVSSNSGAEVQVSPNATSHNQCAPLDFSINYSPTSGASSSQANITSVIWNFSDGSPAQTVNNSTGSVQHSFNISKTYLVYADVTLDNGCTLSTNRSITINSRNISIQTPNDICKNISNTYSFSPIDADKTSQIWNFGGGITSTLETPTHSYTSSGSKTVSVQVFYANNCSVTVSKTINVNESSVSIISPSPLQGCMGEDVSFGLSYTSSPGTSINNITWDFGDGSNSSISSPNHSYNSSGVKNVTVTATNTVGCVAVDNVSINIDNPIVGIAALDDVCDDLPVNFAVFYQSLVESNPDDILWNFGNGNTSNSQTPTHTFGSVGNKAVTVTTTTKYGCTATSTSSLNVQETINRDLEIQGFNNLCLGKEMPLFAKDNANDAVSYNWTFGNSTSSNIQNPRVLYLEPGKYTISVTANYSQTCITQTPALPIEVNVADYDFCTSCEECIGSFAPAPGERYVLSAWVKEDDGMRKATYSGAAISFLYEGVNTRSPNFIAQGPIIEGWQLIEEEFVIPDNTSAIQIELLNLGTDNVFFDDIRIYPFNANLKSFVYDPITMRLTAELDENNYATFYEYDEDGNLIRVKKETERGIKTIQETIKRTRQDD